MKMPLLEVKNLVSGYGDVVVLRDVSLSVEEGEIVSLVGANGAGKTTFLNTVSGIVTPRSGEIWFQGKKRIDNLPPHKIVELGIVQVPEGRKLFPYMTVTENLLLGSVLPRSRAKRKQNLEKVFSLLPKLAERKDQIAYTLSGGEQQMLAIGRALMAEPRLLLFDEPSLGLAPVIVSALFKFIKEINEQGITVLLVEQNVKQSLLVSNRTYVLENGKIVLSGLAKELIDNSYVKEAYLGL